MDWLLILKIVGYVALGIFGIKTFFFDIPLFVGPKSWKEYTKYVVYAVLIFGAFWGISHMFGDSNPLLAIVILGVVLFCFLFLRSVFFD